MSPFFNPFCGKIVIVIFFILAIAIKNRALRLNNKKWVTEKSAVWFEPRNQKKFLVRKSWLHPIALK